MKGLTVKNLEHYVPLYLIEASQSGGEAAISETLVKSIFAYINQRTGRKQIDYGNLSVLKQYEIIIRKDPGVDINEDYFIKFDNQDIKFHSVNNIEENDRFLKIEGIVL